MISVRSSGRESLKITCLSALAVIIWIAACGDTVKKEIGSDAGGSGGATTDALGTDTGAGTGGAGGSGGVDDGGQNTDGAATPDTAGPPTMTSSSPSHEATGVAVDSTIVLEFSESMDRASVTLTLTPNVALRAPAWSSSSDTVTFIPQAVLAANTMYTATVAGRDTTGMALTGTNVFSFTTGAPPDAVAPTITATSPTTGATDVALTAPISVTFSEPIDPGTLTVKLGATVLDVMLNDTNTVATVASTNLTASTMYTVAIEASDVSGNALGGPKTFAFTTGAPADSVRPTVVSTAPDNNATGVAGATEIAITFSEPMNRPVTEGAVTISGAVSCAGRWLWNGDNTFMSCRPAAPLANSTMYTVTVGTAAADPAANTLMAAHVFTFTTAAAPDVVPPTIVNVLPAAGTTGVSRTTNVTVTFSEPMDLASAQTAFQITVNGNAATAMGTYLWTNGGKTLNFNPTVTFPYGAAVVFSVNMAAKDAAGNAKTANNSYSFTVIRLLSTTLYATAALDGYVNSSGTLFSTLTSLVVGDLATNIYAHGFLSFNLAELNVPADNEARTRIANATLYVNQLSVTGAPYTVAAPAAANLGHLLADHVSYGPTLDAGDLMSSTLGARTFTLSTTATAGIKAVSVPTAVMDDWTNRATRSRTSQFRIRFTRNLTANATADFARLVSGNETTTPNTRPRLILSYETP